MTDSLKFKDIVWQIVASIPEGKVVTYGQVAKMAGFPNHARFVGSTLKALPNDSHLPWHRVVNAKRQISFIQDSAAYNRQYCLLHSEGVIFNSNDKILLEHLWKELDI